MLSEHIIYSTALAILISIPYVKYTGRDPTWIIILMCFAPDIDYFLSFIMPSYISHGDFHNILALIVFTAICSWILVKCGVKTIDAIICTSIGFTAHLLEDAFVYNPAYAFFYPISNDRTGWAIIRETFNLYPFGSTNVIIFGVFLLAIAIGLKYFTTDKLKEMWICQQMKKLLKSEETL
jgi:hypothetical protein